MPDDVLAPNIELFSRNGFAGPNTTIVRAQYRPRFLRARGEYLPRRFHTWDLPDQVFAEPKALPVAILEGEGIGFELSRRAAAMTFGYVNVWADELHYIVSGRGRLDTEVGTLDVRTGDFVLIPRAVTYRWGEIAEEINEFIVVTTSELRLDPEGAPATFNPDLHLDRPVPHGRPGDPVDDEYEIVVRTGDKFTSYFYDVDPIPCLDVIGAPLVVRFNIENVQGLGVAAGGLAPAQLMSSTSGRDFVFGVGSRHSARPPVHHNADFDEVICYGMGPSPWGSVDTPGTITWTPKGILHQGPEENVQPGYRAWLLETRSSLTMTPAGRDIAHLMETDRYGVHPAEGQPAAAR
ncbi:homogentisate 1,2-dioxygenase [Nocardia carnea]|uniref:homogentisate 1,2-dioxygenase n=1 Tax=Nocardia carnea TaxID=37328 RepID=UPI002456D7F9|nr:homogentisate 1,2-dioxygenase [Nocardia carnea]